jgi:hypothetical protein
LLQEAQQTLNLLGLHDGNAHGQPGPRTTQAIETFQRQQNLSVTGRLDQPTIDRLRQIRATRFERQLGAPGTGTLSGAGPAPQASGAPARPVAAPVARVDGQSTGAASSGPTATFGAGSSVDWGSAGRTPPAAATPPPITSAAVAPGAAPIVRGAAPPPAPASPLVAPAVRPEVSAQAIPGAVNPSRLAASEPVAETGTILGLTGWAWLIPLGLLGGFGALFGVGYARAGRAKPGSVVPRRQAEPGFVAPTQPQRKPGERAEPSF